MSVREGCTEKCEAAPTCATCSRVKAPIGRDVPCDAEHCTEQCAGYRIPPIAGHLFPGELARSREVES